MKLKKDDIVKTKHGEKLTVLDVNEGRGRYLAESGGHLCWFPISQSKKLKIK